MYEKNLHLLSFKNHYHDVYLHNLFIFQKSKFKNHPVYFSAWFLGFNARISLSLDNVVNYKALRLVTTIMLSTLKVFLESLKITYFFKN